MKKIKNHRLLFSRVLLLLYLFGSLVLSFFHQHPYGKAASQNTTQHKVFLLKVQENAANTDCLACHFHQNVDGALPAVFIANFSIYTAEPLEGFFYTTAFHFTQLRAASLRGPPLV